MSFYAFVIRRDDTYITFRSILLSTKNAYYPVKDIFNVPYNLI